MVRLFVIFLIACFWACNQHFKGEVSITGRLTHYKGDKVYVEVCGQDSLAKASLDSLGRFELRVKLKEAGYARLMNGKAACPLYLQPGGKYRLEMDVEKVKRGAYESVVFPDGVNKETRMMLYYYENQWFPSTVELFVYPPVIFRELMDSVVAYNDAVVDDFLDKDAGRYDREFVELFKWQIKVPFAVSYFYYPMYHALLNPEDSSEIPEHFNLFDGMLPKNDVKVYNRVYRYKTYEVAYWNHVLGVAESFGDYWNRLAALKLHPQIREDVAYHFVMEQAKNLSEEDKQAVRGRYEEFIRTLQHRQKIGRLLDLSEEGVQ